jgi:phage major head subunit gpT-like protein
MLINNATLRGLNTTFNGNFAAGYAQTATWYQSICTEVPSSSRSNTYVWAAKINRMRKWLGERVVQNLTAHSYTVVNETYENTVGVNREDIEDDNLGVYKIPTMSLGEEAKKHPDDLVVSLLQNGHTSLCFDGQFFYDTDHPVNVKDSSMGVQSNYVASGRALTQANFQLAMAEMSSRKGDDGRPLRVRGTLLQVPPALEATAISILNADFLASGASNVTKGMAKYEVVPELAGQDTTWYLHDTSKIVKPFVYQLRRGAAITAKMNLTDDNVFWQNEYIWGVDMRDAAGYGLWFLSSKYVA